MIKKELIVKKIEAKFIVWLETTNQYLIIEPLIAKALIGIYTGIDIKVIAKKLQDKLGISLEKAFDLILDIEEQFIKSNQEKETSNSLHYDRFQKPEKFEFEKYYSINSKIFKVHFSNEFELSLIHPKFAHLEVSDVKMIHYHFDIFNSDEQTFLTSGDQLVGSWSKKDIHYFQGKFSMKIIESIYEKLEQEWLGVFHASAVGKNDQSILILGNSGNGKSTSLSLLQAYDYDCIADDFVPLDRLKKVYSFPAGISVKKKSLDTLLPFYPELKKSAEYYYKRLHKTVRYLPPKDLDFSKVYTCKALIFIKYDSSIEFKIQKISNLKAFEKLIPDSWISPLPQNVAIFLDWFSSLACYELTYSNNKKMIDKITDILHQ